MKKQYSSSRNWMLALALATAGQCAMAIDVKDEAGLRNIANDLAGEYTLTSDILLTGPWAPLGSDETPFTGKINGNGHVIKGLYVLDQETNRNAFINSAKGATITKLGLDDVNVVGRADVGGLLGKDKGDNTISECFVTGMISGSDHIGALIGGCTDEAPSVMENCYALAYVHSRDYQAGGLIGTPIDIEVNNCYFAGTIYARDNCAGGIASLIDGGSSFVLNNSFAATPLLVRANYSFGSHHRVLGSDNGKAYTFDNNYALADTRMGKYDALQMSDSDDATSLDGAGKSFAELTSPDFIANTLGWDGAVWTTAAGVLPRLSWQKEASIVEKVYADYNTTTRLIAVGEPTYLGNGTLPGAVYTSSNTDVATVDNNGVITGKTSGKTTITVSVPADATHKGMVAKSYEVELVGVVYNITNASELNAMRFDLAGEYTLANDIDLASVANFEAIGTPDAPFTGKLLGNGHVIKNLTMKTNGDAKGFFGMADGATIDKVGFENARVEWGNNGGGADFAVVVGRARGVKITNSYVANSYVFGRDHVASFVGGSVSGGDYTLIEDCYSTSRIRTSQYQVAGIMGTMINAHINRCHFSGIVNAPGTNAGAFVSLVDAEADVNSVTNSICLAAKIEGNTTGRILGTTGGRPTTMENNYGLETTSCAGSDNADEAIATGRQGETVSAMDARTADFYTDALGWDMTDTWQMIPDGYPVLAWQTLPVNGQFFGLPDDITLIENKGNFDLGDIIGNLGQEYDVEEVDTKYLRIRSSISCSKWPASTTTTYIRFSSQNPDILSTVEVPVTLIPASESSVKIATPADLVAAAENPGLDYILVNDIDMTGVEFNGIGTSDKPFSGVFDGNGFSIININRTLSDNKRGGLFDIASGAVIKNLGVSNVNVVSKSGQDIGGIVGHATNVTVEECYVTGYVEGNDHVGGIFGGSKTSRLNNSFFNGSVITNGYQAGGLSGVASGLEITNCYAAGEVISNNTSWPGRAAGIIGMTESSGSSMIGVASMSKIAGGIIGHFLGTADGFDRQLAAFEKCIYSTEAEYIPGEGNDADNTSCYELCTKVDDNGNDWSTVPRVQATDGRSEADLRKWETYAAIGWDADVWTMSDNGYPVLKNVAVKEQAGIENVAVNEEGASVNIYGTNGAIVVEAEGDAIVNVYNFSGMFLGQFNVNGSATIEFAPALYIVNVKSAAGVKTSKVLVR